MLKASDFAPDNGFEVSFEDGKAVVHFHYNWACRHRSYDGLGVGESIEEALVNAVRDAEGEGDD